MTAVYDDEVGRIEFSGELIAYAVRHRDPFAVDCEVYRGTGEAAGTFFVAVKLDQIGKNMRRIVTKFEARSMLVTLLSGPPASERTNASLGDSCAFAAMRECLAQLGESN